MKKKVFTVVTAVVIAVSSSAAIAAVMGTWVKVSDSCGRCVMDDINRKCGKCGGFMYSVPGTGSYEKGGYLKYDYKCSKCDHVITYKNK